MLRQVPHHLKFKTLTDPTRAGDCALRLKDNALVVFDHLEEFTHMHLPGSQIDPDDPRRMISMEFWMRQYRKVPPVLNSSGDYVSQERTNPIFGLTILPNTSCLGLEVRTNSENDFAKISTFSNVKRYNSTNTTNLGGNFTLRPGLDIGRWYHVYISLFFDGNSVKHEMYLDGERKVVKTASNNNYIARGADPILRFAAMTANCIGIIDICGFRIIRGTLLYKDGASQGYTPLFNQYSPEDESLLYTDYILECSDGRMEEAFHHRMPSTCKEIDIVKI